MARPERCPALFLTLMLAASVLGASETKMWTDAELLQAHASLRASGDLDEAIRSPKRPHEPPQAAFLEALAWFAAGTPDQPGWLPIAKLDKFIDSQVAQYDQLLRAKVEGEDNDFNRTRTWKVIQKLMLLRDEMARPQNDGRYAYVGMSLAEINDDPWEREHTLQSPEEFRERVCEASNQRPVLVKYGNTNCTQCMLFEMVGSIKELAQRPNYRDTLDVYKVWFGLRPDESFAGQIRNPERLDELTAGEGVSSSPTFVVYRNGRGYSCGDAFPDAGGTDAALDACLSQDFGEAPVARACAPVVSAAVREQG